MPTDLDERGFYRYAVRRLRGAFPTLPDRSQFNRLERAHRDATASFFLHLAAAAGSTAKPTPVGATASSREAPADPQRVTLR